MLSTAGRVILVTGANRGIGKSIATALYREGYTLSLGARRPESLQKLTADWDTERFACHAFVAEDYETHRRWIDQTASRFGRIDGLVNNAGMVVRVGIDAENDAALDQMWAVNVKAPLSMIRLALPHLKSSGSGRVLNVASIAGKQVSNGNVGYSLTKFALVALSNATRFLKWEDGVRCTALCPSFVRTDMTADVETFPHDDMIDASDLAELAVTVLALPNSASVAELVVNCKAEPML